MTLQLKKKLAFVIVSIFTLHSCMTAPSHKREVLSLSEPVQTASEQIEDVIVLKSLVYTPTQLQLEKFFII